jgi:hypothetical protein
MMGVRAHRPGHGGRGDEGVSNVLGAILMFGLLVLTLTVIQVKFVPVWTEDREARHMQTLADDLRQLKSDLDRQAGNDTATPITDSLPLGSAGGFRFFQGPSTLGSTASFTPSPTGAGLIASTTSPVQVLRRGGQDLFGAGTQWDPELEGNPEVTNVLRLEHLRERVDLCQGVVDNNDPNLCPDSYIGDANGNDYDATDSSTLNIYSSTDDVNPLAVIATTVQLTSAEYTFTMHLYDSNGNEVSTISESLFQQAELDYMYFDILDSALFLEPILATGQAPFRIELIEVNNMQADYQVVYVDADSGAITGTAGVLDPAGFSTTMASGSLAVAAQNQHYTDQTYILEHGAVILEQARGSAMAAPPNIGISMGANAGSIAWTVAGLQGSAVGLGSDRIAAVASPTGSVEDVVLAAADLTLTIPTTHGQAWADYLDDLFVAAGWTAGQYTITTTSASVVVDMEGPVPADASCTASDQTNCVYDVSARLRISNISLTLTPAG